MAAKIQEKQIVDPNTLLHDSVTASRSGRDEEKAKFGVGQKVQLLENIVNDGTYPHSPIGTLMMPKGSVGYIKSIGEFLQVIRVYEVHFFGVLDTPIEIVGCREHELLALEDYRDEVEEELEYMRQHRAKHYKKD
ncbi:MAG: nitrogen fixation protein NifZ [Candidatus Marinarcus sp.]|uniref:nitrogen fixation protein NifZ n=1 Tax=Candidatus Marinarcus sp. TaxID=3100987 RepID=UPI003AFFAA0C